MHTAVNRAIQIGRVTMLAIGVGVSIVLVLGFATMALAAVPGDPFKLGQVNVISDATTTLQRDGGFGPALKVEHTGGNGQGILISVPPGKQPLGVSQDAGKANLNVDRFDGKDQTDFLSASRIYGKTALKSGPGGGEDVLFTALDGPEGLACDAGDVALDASANANDINDDLNSIVRSGLGSYQIEFQDNGSAGGLFRVSITCSDSAQPFRD